MGRTEIVGGLRAALAIALCSGHAACDSRAVRASEARATATPAAAVTPAAAAAPTSCGGAGLPDCPLQSWMKSTLRPEMQSARFEPLALAFDKLATSPSFPDQGWKAIARKGALAARARDLDGVREACRSCHDGYRPRYRAERRNQPLL
jgi:hypothetical protein